METVKYDLVWPTEQKRAVRRKNTNLTLYQSQAAEKHNKQEKDANSQSAEAAVHLTVPLFFIYSLFYHM